MKLLTKFNRNYLLLFSATLVLLSFSGYYILTLILKANTRENLLLREVNIKRQIAETGIIPEFRPFIEVTRLNSITRENPIFRQITIYNDEEKESEDYIEYSNTITINETCYLIRIREASVESEDLAFSIAIAIFLLLSATFVISYVITKRLNKTIWHVFETNLDEIERYDFRELSAINLNSANIEEFDRLNLAVTNLTNKLRKDFMAMKEFSENASHELQSPLAIALINLEEILQQDLNKETFAKVITAITAVKRLSTLNQNLLLLTRIENDQFGSSEKISFTKLIEKKNIAFEPLYKAKNLHLNLDSNAEFYASMSTHNANILFNNLISNAINHNIANGSINITIEKDKITICNTGVPNELTNDSVFSRFTKGTSKSYGLGLAIVKQICLKSNLDIKYTKGDHHCFIITPAIERH